jgi:hypothetical protein
MPKIDERDAALELKLKQLIWVYRRWVRATAM